MTAKTFFLALFLLFCLSFRVSGQEEKELTGAVIALDRCNDQSHPVADAFDNDLNTYFMSCPSFGNWIGLDLGEKHIITQVAYCPRMDLVAGSDYRERLQLGVFEGANNPDFGDAIPLFIIPGLVERQLTEQAVRCSKGFRYVRFVFPYPMDGKSSYMSALKFFGHKGEGDHSRLPLLTNLPVVSIHTVDARDVTSKTTYIKGIATFIYADGTKIQTDSLEIRGRGNNSWTHPKKPYRLKLFNKTRLLDLPANARSWTLINNYGDKTLMRNMLAFDFSRRIEMPYTSPAEAVDVVLNGDYKGCYQLCDKVEVRKNRVETDEMTPGDVSGVNLTGGYLIEIDAYAYEEPKRFTSNRYGIPVSIKYPDSDEITAEQENYIAAHFNKLADAVYGSNYKNPQTGFRKYIDTDTFLKFFLVGEYTGNTDTYWSTFMYKRRNDDKFSFGPVWDFDLAFENDNRTYPINTKTTEWLALSGYSSAAGDAKGMIRRILSDDDMIAQLREIYSYYRDRNIISKDVLLKTTDDYAARLDQSQNLNFKRWRIMNLLVHENPKVYGSYAAEVNNVKNYIAGRIDWLDKKLNYVPHPVDPNALENPDLSSVRIGTSENTIHINGIATPMHVRIIDLTGKTIFDAVLSENSAPAVAQGIYLIAVSLPSGEKRTYKSVVP